MHIGETILYDEYAYVMNDHLRTKLDVLLKLMCILLIRRKIYYNTNRSPISIARVLEQENILGLNFDLFFTADVIKVLLSRFFMRRFLSTNELVAQWTNSYMFYYNTNRYLEFY